MKILPPLAVLVVDLTNGFTDPSEPLGLELGDVVARTNELTAWAREREIPVFFTILTSGNAAWERKLPGIGALGAGTRSGRARRPAGAHAGRARRPPHLGVRVLGHGPRQPACRVSAR